MEPRYIDVHSHLFFKDYDQDLEEVMARMRAEGVATLTVGVDKATSEKAVAFAEAHDFSWATVGLHPTDIVTETFAASEYKALAESPKVVAVGECGIDYFRITGDVMAEKKRQWREFEKQAEFALGQDLPLMIHCRPSKGTIDAYEEMYTFLKGKNLRGNMHFFVGNLDVAKKFWNIGFTTSFTGILTFARDYDEVVKAVPLDMFLTETDAPFAAPDPYRGRRNEPSYVKYAVAAIARIRNESEEVIREASVANARRVFALK